SVRRSTSALTAGEVAPALSGCFMSFSSVCGSARRGNGLKWKLGALCRSPSHSLTTSVLQYIYRFQRRRETKAAPPSFHLLHLLHLLHLDAILQLDGYFNDAA